MTQSQACRFETMVNNIAAAPGLDNEIDAFKELLNAAVDVMDKQTLDLFFSKSTKVEARAQKWADDQQE